MTIKTILAVLFFLLGTPFVDARPIHDDAIPDVLKPWQEWVMRGQEERLQCVPDYRSADTTNCAWPATLTMDLLADGGAFRQEWTVYGNDVWLQLPGEKRHWPEAVTINDKAALVVERAGLPFILAQQGRLTVQGRFRWQDMPESFQVPSESALLSVSVDNAPMDNITLNSNGRLWLRSMPPPAGEAKSEDSLALHVYRRIDDQIPPRVDIHLEVQAAGSGREINLGALFPMEAFVPLSLSASLPVKLEQNGELLIQVRPGQWEIDLALRHKGPLSELAFDFPATAAWPPTEIWSFQDQPALRVVKIEGAPAAIDPSQTTMPAAWRNLPAYLVKSGDKLILKEIKRGEPSPPPDQLQLKRDLWLNFDGTGYFVRDTITGSKNNNWRLSTADGRLKLGRVTLDGQDQVITTLGGHTAAGVELRQGIINLEAVSTIERPISPIPATGFDTTFQSVAVKLHLPPGFSLFDLSGAENVHGTWIGAWTLLDLFLLFITTIACFKVFGLLPALVCFVSLVLLYHQPAAPLWGWINIIGAEALRRVIPEGKVKKLLHFYKNGSIMLVVLIAIPFMVTQMRHGLYPQLERPYQRMDRVEQRAAKEAAAPEAPEMAPQAADMAGEAMPPAPTAPAPMLTERAILSSKMATKSEALMAKVAQAPAPPPKRLEQIDPDAKIQTGPGLPTWQWKWINIGFNGPVTKEQSLRILVLSPAVNLLLAVSRCLAILLFLAVLTGARPTRRSLGRVAAALLLLIVPWLSPSPSQAGDLPSPELLKELQQRLLEAPACFPDCVSLDSMTIRQEGEALVFSLDISAYERAAMPLPGYLPQWQPARIWLVKDKGRPPELLRKHDTLWIVVDQGQSTIDLVPRLSKDLRELQINMPLIPHQLKTALTDWTLSASDDSGSIPASLTLTRKAAAQTAPDEPTPELRMGALPAFFSVERTLRFGLTWQVETVVRRTNPAGSAAVISLPLIPGESVLTDGITVKEGVAELVFSQGIDGIEFSSSLAIVPEITLAHAQTDLYSETWRIDPSAIWHISYSGPPVISHQENHRWLPTWRPWPGESVRLTVSRPQAVDGQALTIDQSHLAVEPGRNVANVSLSFTLRASQGGQHSIKIPPAAEAIRKFQINGRTYPIQHDPAGRLVFPVVPGQQEVKLDWTQGTPVSALYTTPAIDLGLASVNSHLSLRMGHDRWPLAIWGARLGPAVLWWSFITVTLLAALGLARLQMVPLTFLQWFLLGVGMLQTNVFLPVVFTLWLIALGKRRQLPQTLPPGQFNLIQLFLAALTLAAVSSLVAAISNGLLGYPNMQIIGNGSNNTLFQWYQDVCGTTLPLGHVISLPIWFYRLLMLAWALWISFTLIRLAKWAWECYSTGNVWLPVAWGAAKDKQ